MVPGASGVEPGPELGPELGVPAGVLFRSAVSLGADRLGEDESLPELEQELDPTATRTKRDQMAMELEDERITARGATEKPT